jgi:hypothetical protein
MARFCLPGMMLALGVAAAFGQETANAALQTAGVCARCHVNAVLEWEMSAHARVGNSCSGCHGVSKGHVADERNNVPPDRIPRGAGAASLCMSCHQMGCPQSQAREACQNCHHVHALVDPRKPVANRVVNDGATEAHRRAMETGEQAAARQDWRSAAVAFREAALLRPDSRALQRLSLSLRRLSPELPGFRPLSAAIHPELGLPLEVEVIGTGIRMILVPGGDVDLGDDDSPALRPAHTVAVATFYIARNPEARKASWREAVVLAEKMNRSIAGGGFRLASEPELVLALQDSRTVRAAGEWCSSLFWPYPYAANDGREDRAEIGPRVRLTPRGRRSGDTNSRAAFRFARSVPPPDVEKFIDPPGKRTP